MTAATPTLAELVHSLHEQIALLVAASKIEAKGQPDIRDELARQHLCHAAELTRGAASLGSIQNAACLGILGRCLLEKLITVLWVIRSLENAQIHQNISKNELAKALKINLNAGKAKIINRDSGEDATAEFLKSEQMKNIPRRKSVEELAKEADVSDLYTVFYRFMSLETHGHNLELLEDSNSVTQSVSYLQGIGAISLAIGQACTWWLLHRSWPDNESIREILGLNHPNT